MMMCYHHHYYYLLDVFSLSLAFINPVSSEKKPVKERENTFKR